MRLSAVMRQVLDGWQQDLDPAWRPLLGNVELGFDAIDPVLDLEPWEPVFPARRGKSFPGAPNGAHMLRAFDGLPPDRVRCIILGQDPYPCPAFATGRAFEAGNVARWRELEKMFSCSFRILLQLVVAERSGDPSYARDMADWDKTIHAIEQGNIAMPAASELAEQWVRQGVLLLNTGLTLTRFAVEVSPHQSRGHLPLWRPLIDTVLRALARERKGPLVFLGFGGTAADALAAAGISKSEALVDGLACILREHPAKGHSVLQGSNPLTLVNRVLVGGGASPINW